MSDSVRERIMKNVQTTIEGITEAGGYSSTLASVQRFQQGGQLKSATPMAIIMEGVDTLEGEGPLAGASSLVSRRLTVGIEITAVQDDAMDPRSASELMNELIADVTKAMLADAGIKRGGDAINTIPGDVTPLFATEGIPDLTTMVEFHVPYRHLRTDPTIAG